jgi:trimethylguanosine synthase
MFRGGAGYLSTLTFPLHSVQPDVKATLAAANKLTDNCAMFLPRNTPLSAMVELLPIGQQMEVELNVVNEKIKAMTVYFGELQDKTCDL